MMESCVNLRSKNNIIDENYSRQASLSKHFRELLRSAICVINSKNSLIIKNILTLNNENYNWHDLIDKTSGSNISNITNGFFINKFKMEQSKLTDAETLGRKHLMKFLENLILNFKSKGISSRSLMGLSKAYYLLDNYKKITYEGYLRLESDERDEEGDLRSYVFKIDSDEAILSYEGYVHGLYGGDSVYEEMFNFDYNQVVFDDPEVIIISWIEEFENIFNNNGSLSIDDSTEEIEEIDEEDEDDYDQEDDEQED